MFCKSNQMLLCSGMAACLVHFIHSHNVCFCNVWLNKKLLPKNDCTVALGKIIVSMSKRSNPELLLTEASVLVREVFVIETWQMLS